MAGQLADKIVEILKFLRKPFIISHLNNLVQLSHSKNPPRVLIALVVAVDKCHFIDTFKTQDTFKNLGMLQINLKKLPGHFACEAILTQTNVPEGQCVVNFKLKLKFF